MAGVIDNRPDKAGLGEVREWAMTKKAGHNLSPRGPLPRYVILAWNKAHPDRPFDGRAFRHGIEGYNHLCRCETCLDAVAARERERYRQRMADGPPEDAVHGRVATYESWGCRCDECRDANHRRYEATH